jgi:hypothetical protein
MKTTHLNGLAFGVALLLTGCAAPQPGGQAATPNDNAQTKALIARRASLPVVQADGRLMAMNSFDSDFRANKTSWTGRDIILRSSSGNYLLKFLPDTAYKIWPPGKLDFSPNCVYRVDGGLDEAPENYAHIPDPNNPSKSYIPHSILVRTIQRLK